MFPTEIDADQVIYDTLSPINETSNSSMIDFENEYKNMSDEQFKPLLQKLIKSTRKKGEFKNVEERII